MINTSEIKDAPINTVLVILLGVLLSEKLYLS